MNPQNVITVWVTKYALTLGILKKDVHTFDQYPRMVATMGPGLTEYYHGKNWHLTKEEAVKEAEAKRAKKLESLRRQIAKLEAMDFVRGPKPKSKLTRK